MKGSTITYEKGLNYEIVCLSVQEHQIFILYSSPIIKSANFFEISQKFINEILVGDFDINSKNATGNIFQNKISTNLHMNNVSKDFTTKKNTEIEALFSDENFENCVYYTPYSYYYCIIIELNKYYQ